MDTFEDADLDCLIGLINEPTESPTTESFQRKNSKNEAEGDLDSLLDLIDENESATTNASANSVKNCNISVDPSPKSVFKLIDLPCDDNPTDKNNDNFDYDKVVDQVSNSAVESKSLIHTGDTSEEEEELKEALTEDGKVIKKRLPKLKFYEDNKRRKTETWKTPSTSKIEPFKPCIDDLVGIKIKNPLVPLDLMQQRMQGRKLVKLSFLSKHTMKELEDNWVTTAVVISKLPPKESKQGKAFSIWKLCDLNNCEKIVSFFLFGQVHTEHWKLSVGTVIGLLNPSFMDGKNESEDICIKVDHPGKLMVIGTSKDFSYCKSTTKSGKPCQMIVNLSRCEFCSYHVKSEYKKFSKRSELQSSYSGRGVNLKNKVLKGHNFFYAGQSFTPLGKPEKSKAPKTSLKDKLTLSNLTLKRKAVEIEHEERKKGVDILEEIYGKELSKAAEKNSDFINNQLTVPSVGSKNFLLYMKRNSMPGSNDMQIMTSKELLKMHQNDMLRKNALKKADATILANLTPKIAKNLTPGQSVSLDTIPCRSKITMTAEDYAKMRAIRKIKENGPIKKQNPNSVKSKPDVEKIQATISNTESENIPKEENPRLAQGKLGTIDLNSERIQKILNRKSSHAYELEMAEMEKEALYFDRMEKRESMEEKMRTTMEMVCDVVSCKQCRYTAHSASDRCKNENHPLKCHKALKRFFMCKDCKNRTDCFTRFPQRACRNCGGSSFERTGMKTRKGPKLDSEVLNICGDEAYYLNSL